MKSPFSHPSAPFNTLFVQSDSNYYLFSYNDDQICGNFEDNLVKLELSEFRGQKGELKLTGCCNGLICLTSLTGEYFILWNPATRKMHKYETHWYIKISPFVSVFGYASSVDDYKYVQLSMMGLGFGKCHNIVHIFSLMENKWRSLDFDYTAFISDNPPVLINEIVLHWPALCHQVGDSMISFDLGVERFDRVNLDSMECLGVMGGCLSTCNSSYGNTGEMLMHIFESESPGVIVKSIGVPEGLRIGMASQMIGFTSTGKFFVTGPLNDDMGFRV
ncbi:uncharacterized protein LOC141608576 [Silene latifolia]|uniref:uncharacterized protein LOC141608576 n=1 Tax=Silene latifolia TaxID=37657 RepID=UPI003D7750D5